MKTWDKLNHTLRNKSEMPETDSSEEVIYMWHGFPGGLDGKVSA